MSWRGWLGAFLLSLGVNFYASDAPEGTQWWLTIIVGTLAFVFVLGAVYLIVAEARKP